MIGRLGSGSIKAFEPPSRFTKIRDDVYRFYQRPIVHPNSIPYGEYAYLPRFFYLQYIIKLARGNQYITAACIKDDTVGRISTSSYSLMGNTSLGLGTVNNWAYNGGAVNTPDDYDSTWIDGAGYHYLISGPNTALNPDLSSQTASQMWRYKINENNNYYSVASATNTPGFKSDNVIQVGLPAIKQTLFFNQAYYYFYDHVTGSTTANINWTGLDSDASTILTTILSGLSTGTSARNKFRWVSDGINSVWFTSIMNVATGSTYGTSGVGYLYFDLSTSSPTVEFSKSYNVSGVTTSWTGAVGYGNSNTSMTEEDCNGDGLYTIDGSISYLRNNTFYFGTSALATRPSMFADWLPASLSSATVGTNDSQQGSDVLGPICTDNIVTIADNGHDDGGIFAVNTATQDSCVTWARTNIELLTVPPSALGGSSATAANTVAEIAATGQRGKGYFYINTPNGGIKRVWCDFDTLDENGNTGWMLVASWTNGSTWTQATNSSSNIVGPGNLTYGWSSNFGDYTINQFRVTANWNAQDALGPNAAGGDWYYYFSTAVPWKTVWSPANGNYNWFNGSAGDSDKNITAFSGWPVTSNNTGGTVERACLRGFNWAYNLKYAYKASTQRWNGLSDPSATQTATFNCNFWSGLTTSGVSLNCNVNGDGSLAIIPSGTTWTTAAQDCDHNQSKVGYDDTGVCYYYGASATADQNTNVATTGTDWPLYFWIK